MEETAVLYEIEEHTALLTLNREKSLNAMNDALVDALHEALERAEVDSEVKTVVLTGRGRAFCAGGDLAYLKSLTDAPAAHAFIQKVGALVTRIRSLSKPVIAMVNGAAAGAGFNLALSCDVIFCSDKAKFAQSFAKVGLVPDCGGMYLLPRAVGLHKAKELMFTADLISAQEAFRLQLVNYVVAADALRSKTMAFAKKLQLSAPLALRLIKQTLNNSDTLTLPALLESEAAMQTMCMQTGDHKEGIAAFMEKRAPKFTGK